MWLYICQHLVGELDKSVRPIIIKVNLLFIAAARAAQHMPKLLEIKLRMTAHRDIDPPPCEMVFAARGHCSKEDINSYHAVLRCDGFLFLSSKRLALRSCHLDLSKPWVSVIMPSKYAIDDRLAQVWKTSKGEDVDYRICSGVVLYDDDDNDDDNNND